MHGHVTVACRLAVPFKSWPRMELPLRCAGDDIWPWASPRLPVYAHVTAIRRVAVPFVSGLGVELAFRLTSDDVRVLILSVGIPLDL